MRNLIETLYQTDRLFFSPKSRKGNKLVYSRCFLQVKFSGFAPSALPDTKHWGQGLCLAGGMNPPTGANLPQPSPPLLLVGSHLIIRLFAFRNF